MRGVLGGVWGGLWFWDLLVGWGFFTSGLCSLCSWNGGGWGLANLRQGVWFLCCLGVFVGGSGFLLFVGMLIS